MSRGHKGKSPMIKERTRKLSKVEQLLLEEGAAVLDNKNHVKIINSPSEKVVRLKEKHIVLQTKSHEDKLVSRQIKLEAVKAKRVAIKEKYLLKAA